MLDSENHIAKERTTELSSTHGPHIITETCSAIRDRVHAFASQHSAHIALHWDVHNSSSLFSRPNSPYQVCQRSCNICQAPNTNAPTISEYFTTAFEGPS